LNASDDWKESFFPLAKDPFARAYVHNKKEVNFRHFASFSHHEFPFIANFNFFFIGRPKFEKVLQSSSNHFISQLPGWVPFLTT